MLGFSLQINWRSIFNNSLHRHLNKFIKGIQLLPD